MNLQYVNATNAESGNVKSPVGSFIYAPVMYNSLSPGTGVERMLGFNLIPELMTPGSSLYVDPAKMSQYFGPGKQVREPRGSAPYDIGGECLSLCCLLIWRPWRAVSGCLFVACLIGDDGASTSIPLRGIASHVFRAQTCCGLDGRSTHAQALNMQRAHTHTL